MTAPETMGRLVLASASPRRRELLGRLGLQVDVVPAQVDESPREGEPPPVQALRVARDKLEAVAVSYPLLPVLAADTVVALGGRALGKPRDEAEAREMLRFLSGRTHFVFTAVAAGWQGRKACHLEAARVTFVHAPRELQEWYAQSGEGGDKAGAYALQGAAAVFVSRVLGNVQAVVGLPLAVLPQLFRRLGLELRRSPTGGLCLSPRV